MPAHIPQENQPLFAFGVIADIQYGEYPPMYNRYFAASLQKLEQALQTFRRQSLAFILDLGDLIDRDFESFAPLMH